MAIAVGNTLMFMFSINKMIKDALKMRFSCKTGQGIAHSCTIKWMMGQLYPWETQYSISTLLIWLVCKTWTCRLTRFILTTPPSPLVWSKVYFWINIYNVDFEPLPVFIMKENIYQTERGLMAWAYAMMLLFAMICIVILGITVKYIRLRAAFKRDKEASNDSVLKGGNINAATD